MMRAAVIGIAATGLVALGAATYAPAAPPHPAPAAAQPYAGLQDRAIKALPPERVAELLAGKGAGYALAAELNRYPGPKHVLDFSRELQLTPEQEHVAQGLITPMDTQARVLGARIVDLEAQLAGC